MENLNAEQIIKALECCHTNSEIDCRDCPYWNKVTDLYDGCVNTLVKDALSLIKQLTEDNERLRASSIDYRNIPDIISDTRANTVRKMQERVQSFLTDEETDVIIAEGEVFIPISAVRKIAKEMVEGKDEP